MNTMELLSNITSVISMKLCYKLKYFRHRGHFPNFKNPKDISERLLSEMLKPSFVNCADYADKIKVREYMQSKGLEGILLKHYGVWEKADLIDFDLLPNKFALKTNNGCGNHIFCKDKSTLNRKECIRHLNEALRLPAAFNREPHYKHIKPLIFCEELIDTGTDSWPTDYKFTCIKGKPFDIFVATERQTKAKYCTFDMDWNVLNYTKEHYLPKTFPGKPKNLDQMIEVAKLLSGDFDIVRVDLYDTGDRILFGELTFTPWGGMMYSYTNEAIEIMGNHFN